MDNHETAGCGESSELSLADLDSTASRKGESRRGLSVMQQKLLEESDSFLSTLKSTVGQCLPVEA